MTRLYSTAYTELVGLIIPRLPTLCGVVYIPPEYSSYSVDNPFSEIEQELGQFSDIFSSIILFGDFNSRTRNMIDYVIPDLSIFHNNNFDEVYEEIRADM